MAVDLPFYALVVALGGSPAVAQAATDPTGLGVGTVVQTGAVTTLAGALVWFSKVVWGREVIRGDEARAELREVRAELRELNGKIMTEYAPTLTRATDAISELTSALARGGSR